MSNDGGILGSRDGSDHIYFPFNRLVPYPKFLVINVYGGYDLIDGKLICLTNLSQMSSAQRMQTALAEIGFAWNIKVHQPDEGRENVGVQCEIKPLKYGPASYELEIEMFSPNQQYYQDGIISLVANDLLGLENGFSALIQVIQLAFAEFGNEIASLWIQDWPDTSQDAE